METAAIGWAVSPFFSFIVNKTLDCLKKPLKRIHGMEADLEKLKQILPEVQSVVSVAETLKVVNPHQADLLRQMKDAVYDADDVMDEFNYRLLEVQAAKEEDSVAEKFGAMVLTAGKRLVGADPLQTSLSKAIESLERVNKTADAFIRTFNLEKAADQGQSSKPQLTRIASGRETVSNLQENIIVGREADRKNILCKIQEQANSDSSTPLVICIVGEGGIGKTTLAQLVYNDEAISFDVFDQKIWVCVANNFDEIRVTKQVLSEVRPQNIEHASWDKTIKELQESLHSKKSLIVLDDVWVERDQDTVMNREAWKKFFSTFKQCRGGNSIVVTTRLTSVVKMIGNCMKVNLSGLSVKDSTSLFMSHAFSSWESGATCSKELEAIVEKIVDKLNGLPLALKFVGMHLSDKHSVDDWEDVLKNTKRASGNVLSVLKLSYDHLPSHLKHCFAYCSLFPKGWYFSKDEVEQLIQMWIAQGFVHKENEDARSLEVIGRCYFDDLCSRFFFQTIKNWDLSYVMHDLINDLALSVSKEECCQMLNDQSCIPSTLRHVSVSSIHLPILSKIPRLDKLRTLLVLNQSKVHVCIPMQDEILASLTGARVLGLSGCCIEKLPESIKQMIHLRYLAFDRTSMLLPETCSRLFNLQVVCMTGYRYETCDGNICKEDHDSFAQKNMSSLNNLKWECLMCKKVFDSFEPKIICGLNNLRWDGIICKKNLDSCAPKNMSSLNNLSHVYVSDGYPVDITGHWKIPQFHGNAVFTLNLDNKLEDIQDIGFQGNLAIQKLENAGSKHDDLKPVICQNGLMKDLKLEWSLSAPVCRNNDNDVFEFLVPPSSLSSLQVCGYRGSKCPFWLKNNYLTNLSSLHLRKCSELRELPPLGQLSRLEVLELSALNAVEEISPEFYGTEDKFGFPSLKRLVLTDMQNLVEWSMPECRPLFPLLERVSIIECYKLKRVPNIFPVTEGFKRLYIDEGKFEFAFVSCAPTGSSGGQDNVEKLREMGGERDDTCLFWKVTDFSGFKFVSGDIESLLEVRTCKLEILDFHRDFNSHSEAVKDLYIFNCRPPLLKVGFTKLSSLERLSIEESEHILWLRVLPREDYNVEKEDDDVNLPTSLKSLTIRTYRATSNFFSRYFQSLSSLVQLELEYVYLEGMIIDLHRLTRLTELRIRNCKNPKGINGLGALTCLTTMEIMGTPFSYFNIAAQHQFLKPFSSLSTLKISDLYFDSSEGMILNLQHSRGLKVLHISRFWGKIKLINCNALTSLAELVIDDCPGLIINPADWRFLNSSCKVKLNLNYWVPFVECKSLRLPNSFGARQISRLIYTNSGMELLALDSNAMHLLWKWPRNEWNPCKEATARVIPQLWQPPSGIFMMNDITDSNSEDASPCVALSKDNSYVISASGGKISLFNIVTFEKITTFMPPPPAATFLAFCPHDRNIIAIGMDDSTIQIYNVKSDEIICHLKGHSRRITGLAFSTVLNVLVSSGADCQICVWSTDGWEKQKNEIVPDPYNPYGGPYISITRVQFHRDQLIFLVVQKSLIAIYEATTLECVRQWVTPLSSAPSISDATFSCDGQLLYATFDDATVYIFDASNLTIRCRIFSAANLPPNVSPNVHPLVVAAHPSKPNQIAIGLTDGGVHVLEYFESEGKWFAAQLSQNPSSSSLPINAAPTPECATANEVQETKREDKAESRNNDCSKMLGSHLTLSCSSSRPECVKLLRPEKKTESGASISLTPEQLFQDVDFDTLGSDGSSLRDLIFARWTSAGIFVLDPPSDQFSPCDNIVITYKDIEDLLKMKWLNVSVIQFYMMKLYYFCQQESIGNIGFMDPARINATQLRTAKEVTITYMANAIKSPQIILAPYFEANHWVLLVIKPSEKTVYALDSLNNTGDKNYVIKDALVEAFSHNMQDSATLCWITHPSPQQPGGFECGYYVMNLMRDIIKGNREFPEGTLPESYTVDIIYSVRRSWVQYFLELLHSREFKSDYQHSRTASEEAEEEDAYEVQEAECEEEAKNQNGGPQEAEQTTEFDKHEAIRNEEFRREIEQARRESLQNLNIHNNNGASSSS